jgi:hypothetical protein
MRTRSWLVLLFVLAQLEPSIPFDGKEEKFHNHCRGNKESRYSVGKRPHPIPCARRERPLGRAGPLVRPNGQGSQMGRDWGKDGISGYLARLQSHWQTSLCTLPSFQSILLCFSAPLCISSGRRRGGEKLATGGPGIITWRTPQLVPAKCAGKKGAMPANCVPVLSRPTPTPSNRLSSPHTASGAAEAWATRAVQVRTRILQLRSEDRWVGNDARFVDSYSPLSPSRCQPVDNRFNAHADEKLAQGGC